MPDVGRFLSSLLPQQGPVPGALRYAIARAQQDVDAPPFGSLEEFAAALERFEKGNRQEVLRGLYSEVVVFPGLPQASAAQVAGPQAVASAVITSPTPVQSPAASVPSPSLSDRRRRMPSATELRRQLREADRQLYEARLMLKRETPASAPPPLTFHAPSVRTASPTSYRLAAVGAVLALGVSSSVTRSSCRSANILPRLALPALQVLLTPNQLPIMPAQRCRRRQSTRPAPPCSKMAPC